MIMENCVTNVSSRKFQTQKYSWKYTTLKNTATATSTKENADFRNSTPPPPQKKKKYSADSYLQIC